MLEIVDKADGAMFSFDDVELATLIAGVAGVALDDAQCDRRPRSPGPDELAGELRRLAAARSQSLRPSWPASWSPLLASA